MKYQVKIYKGDYENRQQQANEDNAICYFEQHFNASESFADYSMVVVGTNASETSKQWGAYYTKSVSQEFYTTDRGIIIGGFNGRGNGNLIHTDMPAILAEPLFITTKSHFDYLWQEDGIRILAYLITDSIKTFFPNGGLVALSIGHKYKTSSPTDRGAIVPSEFRRTPEFIESGILPNNEADIAELVIEKVREILER